MTNPRNPDNSGQLGRAFRVWPFAVFVVAGLAAYSNTFQAPFVFDDIHPIVENPHIRSLWPPWKPLITPPDSPVSGRPLVSLTLAFNYCVSGTAVWSYHALNLSLHLICASLLFILVRGILRLPRFAANFEGHEDRTAAAIALLFTVHPLQTDAVTYTIQRTELLMATFYLATLYAVLRACTASERGWVWQVMAVSACVFGMLCKEVMVSAPLAALLLDRTFVAGSFSAALRRRSGLYLGLALTWIVPAIVLVSSPRSQSVGFNLDVTPLEYLRTQSCVIVHYLRLSIWPTPLVLSYGWWMVTTWSECLLQFLLLSAMFLATLWLVVRRSWLGFLGACFFMILAPSSSFVPIVTEIAAERRMYLPLATVIIAAVVSVRHLVIQRRRPFRGAGLRQDAGAVGFMVLVTILAVMTHRRNADYQSLERIWTDVVSKRPENAGAHFSLALVYSSLGRLPEAERHLRRAMEIRPDHAFTHPRLADVLVRQGRLTEAVEQFLIALRITPNDPQVHMDLGIVLARLGRNEQAHQHLREAVRLSPDRAVAHNNLGVVLASLGRRDEAIAEFKEAIRLQPDHAEARANLTDLTAAPGP